VTTAQPTWLITGASGFLGANLGLHLAGRARRIAVTRSGSTPSHFDEAISGDLVDVDAWVPHLITRRPDVIVHAGAMAAHQDCERAPELAHLINAEATESLASAADACGARFVYISTDAVFDGRRGHYAEDEIPSPTSVYGRTKLAGEERARRATDALIIRTNFFGWSPSGTRSILEFFVNELGAGNRVRGFTDFTTTSAYAPVLAETIEALVSGGATGTFHVTSPDALTKYAFGVAVADEFGLDSGLITPTNADIHPPRNGDISLDVSRAEAALGRSLPTQVEGIRLAQRDTATLRQALWAAPGS
jgi:dTDP-4-dehydrorhamnose reductase